MKPNCPHCGRFMKRNASKAVSVEHWVCLRDSCVVTILMTEKGYNAKD